MREENRARVHKQFWRGADLVMEVLSSDRWHDLETKRSEYARGGVLEYWIVDPEVCGITVLKLDGDHYVEAGVYRPGDQAVSQLLPDFNVDVTSAFEAK